MYWQTAELQANVIEALRTWNAAAQYWRTRVQFSTTAGVPFYDLSSVVSSALGYSITDQDLVTSMEYSLLEPPTSTWTGTDQFTLTDLTDPLERRRDQFLVETGTVIKEASEPNSLDRIALPNSVIDIRRASWQSQAGFINPLWRSDEIALNSFNPGWNTNAATPAVYSVSLTPPFTVQLGPKPDAAGIIDFLLVEAGATLDGSGVLLGIPDDYAWGVKWGALADCLGRDGQARDPQRSAYCEKRWQECIHLAKMASSVLQAQINGVALQISDLFSLDALNPTWQNSQGQPTTIAMAGLNMMALSPVPDGAYSVLIDVVQNAPIPATSVPLGLPKDVSDVILDEAQHIAAFKMGGDEFLMTMPHHERFMRLAEVYRARTKAQTRYQQTMFDRGRRQLKQIPMEMIR